MVVSNIRTLPRLYVYKYMYYNVLLCADLADLNLPKTCQIDFPDPDDLLNFRLVITPDEVHVHVHTCYCTMCACV